MAICYVPVGVSEGMFSTEYVATMLLSSGKQIEIFVDKYLVKSVTGYHYLKCTLLEGSIVEDTARVVLPKAPAFCDESVIVEIKYSSCLTIAS